MEGREAIPGDRGLERLGQHSDGYEHVAQVRSAQERLAPAADRFAGRRRRAAPTIPPWSAQHSSALVIERSTSCSADSNPSTSSACEPSPAPVTSASRASIRRQLVGYRPDCESARTASAPAHEARRSAPAVEARWTGRRRTLTHASVIIPSVPSEPISIRSGETPAPEPGSRRDSHTPAGRERPHRLDQVVDVGVERGEVAAGAGGDPAAERRELKRLREVAQGEPVRAELLLEARAGGAGLDPRRQRTGSTSSTRSSALRSIVTTPA